MFTPEKKLLLFVKCKLGYTNFSELVRNPVDHFLFAILLRFQGNTEQVNSLKAELLDLEWLTAFPFLEHLRCIRCTVQTNSSQFIGHNPLSSNFLRAEAVYKIAVLNADARIRQRGGGVFHWNCQIN